MIQRPVVGLLDVIGGLIHILTSHPGLTSVASLASGCLLPAADAAGPHPVPVPFLRRSIDPLTLAFHSTTLGYSPLDST